MYGLLMVVMTSCEQNVFVKERVETASVRSRQCPPIACAFTVRLGGLPDGLRFPLVFPRAASTLGAGCFSLDQFVVVLLTAAVRAIVARPA